MKRREFIVGAASLATFRGSAVGMARTKVLFDTDIGVDVDDAFALAYLLSEPQCDLAGITTAGGHPELRAEMASAVCTAFGRPDIPIHPGCDRTLLYPRPSLDPASARELGDLPRKRFAADGSAVEFMRRTIRANPGAITLVAVAPYANVARLFLEDPEIPELLDRMVVMGTRCFEKSDSESEWNMMCDPEATILAFGPGSCNRVRETTFHGLNVTEQAAVKPKRLVALCQELKPLNFLTPTVERFFETHPYYEECGKALHDPLACVGLFHPEVCTFRRGHVQFTVGGTDRVLSRFVEDAKGRQLVATDVNVDLFYSIYRQTCQGKS